jgi:histidinol-phosphate aminotransferase
MKIHESISTLVPYRPGRPISAVKAEYGLTDVIKLASNENPLGPSPRAVEAIQRALRDLAIYPDPASASLIQKLSQHLGVSPREIALGNGSDELFDQLIRIFANPGDSILVSKGAFSAYPISARAARVNVIETELRADLQIDLKAFSQVLAQFKEEKQIKLVFIPNINNPTGLLLKQSELNDFLDEWGQDPDLFIILDEAYHEFVRDPQYQSGLQLRTKYSNVLVSRTFSKTYGLAGLRVGLLVAPEQVVDYINRVRKPFNVNTLAQVAAEAALDDVDFLKRTCELNWKELDKVQVELTAMGIDFLPSQGNFVMLNTRRNLQQVETFFLKHGVIIRPLDNYGFKTWIRLSIGLPEQNELALKVLKKSLDEIEPC